MSAQSSTSVKQPIQGVHPKIPASKFLVGHKITDVRPLDADERDQMGWSKGVVIQLDNGTLLIPQSDDEGNAAGTVTVQTPDGKTHCLLEMAR